MGRIQVYSPKEEREKADIAVRVGNKLVKKLTLGSRASFEVLFGDFHGYTVESISGNTMTVSKELA